MDYSKVKISEDELKIIELPERLSALEVANKLRFPERSNFSNKFQIDLTPYLSLPISLIGKNAVEWIFIIKPTQSGGTVFLQVAVADTIDQDPGTLVYITPDEKLTGKGMKRIINIIKRTPDLVKHVINKKSLSKSNISLDNMEIFPAWAGSLATLSETPAKRVILDEIRLMPLTLGAESNAIKMADDRLTTFKAHGLAQGYGVSTPSVEGDLLHQQLTIPGTIVLRWCIKCKYCGQAQILDFWKNIKIVNKKAICKCVKCGSLFNDKDRKKEMNSNGFYAVIDPKTPTEPKSFELPKLKGRIICWYSSLDSPFRSWSAIYSEFKTTRDKLHDYKNFIQCWLAQFWIDDISKTSTKALDKRRVKHLDRGTVPSWTKVLLGGIDTQDDGFYVVIRAFGEGKRTHLVDHYFINSKIDIADTPEIYKLIKRGVEDRIFLAEDNITKWRVALYGWDTGGHRTKHIYAAVKKGLVNAIMVKGEKNTQDTTIKYNKDLNLYLVKTMEYLDETEKHCMSESFTLPDNVGAEYMRHFCNRRKKKEKNKQTREDKVIWVKVGNYDYRMADIHAYICLDIQHTDGTFRFRLEDPKFVYNPVVRATTEMVEDAYYDDEEFEEENVDNYEIGELSDW